MIMGLRKVTSKLEEKDLPEGQLEHEPGPWQDSITTALNKGFHKQVSVQKVGSL